MCFECAYHRVSHQAVACPLVAEANNFSRSTPGSSTNVLSWLAWAAGLSRFSRAWLGLRGLEDPS